jgi:hypothetical protein
MAAITQGSNERTLYVPASIWSGWDSGYEDESDGVEVEVVDGADTSIGSSILRGPRRYRQTLYGYQVLSLRIDERKHTSHTLLLSLPNDIVERKKV